MNDPRKILFGLMVGILMAACLLAGAASGIFIFEWSRSLALEDGQ